MPGSSQGKQNHVVSPPTSIAVLGCRKGSLSKPYIIRAHDLFIHPFFLGMGIATSSSMGRCSPFWRSQSGHSFLITLFICIQDMISWGNFPLPPAQVLGSIDSYQD